MIPIMPSPPIDHEFRKLMGIAVPGTLSMFSFFAISITELSVIGHLGVDQLAAVAYSQMAMDFSTLVFMQGFNAGMNALCSQAYGAKNYHLLAQYGLLTATMLTVMCLPVALLWWHLGTILALAGVSGDVASYATVYSRLWVWGMWPRSMFQVLSIFYQSQQIVVPTTAINAATVVVNAVLASGLTHGQFGFPALGFIGCPIGTVVAMWLRLGFYYYYMHNIKKYDNRTRWAWSHESFSRKSLASLVAVGFPLAAGNLFENSQLQVIALFTAKIGEVQLGTHNSMMELFLFATSPIFGISDAAVTRIGKHLGAGNADLARTVTRIAGSTIAVIAVATMTAMVVFRESIGTIFTEDPTTLASFNEISGTAAATFVFLAFFLFSLMILEAQARSIPLMVAYIVGSWGVGVPAAYFLGLCQGRRWFLGVWLGMICGYVVTACIAIYYALCTTDWDVAARDAVARSQLSKEENETTPLVSNEVKCIEPA